MLIKYGILKARFISFFENIVPPMMWVPQQQISAVQGSKEVTLDCVVEAHPEALTFWEKGGRMLQTGGRFNMNTLRQTPSYKVGICFRHVIKNYNKHL